MTATDLHHTAIKVLRAVQVTEERATNHLEWIADEAGVSDSTVSRWLNRLADEGLTRSYEQDWIWGDRHKYWRTTTLGDQELSSSAAALGGQESQAAGSARGVTERTTPRATTSTDGEAA